MSHPCQLETVRVDEPNQLHDCPCYAGVKASNSLSLRARNLLPSSLLGSIFPSCHTLRHIDCARSARETKEPSSRCPPLLPRAVDTRLFPDREDRRPPTPSLLRRIVVFLRLQKPDSARSVASPYARPGACAPKRRVSASYEGLFTAIIRQQRQCLQCGTL